MTTFVTLEAFAAHMCTVNFAASTDLEDTLTSHVQAFCAEHAGAFFALYASCAPLFAFDYVQSPYDPYLVQIAADDVWSALYHTRLCVFILSKHRWRYLDGYAGSSPNAELKMTVLAPCRDYMQQQLLGFVKL